ncbi:hypothetical protein [Marimonas lutisalis]|uniref:hypothetical protein n=1 Tax=Marimonas lutisalis TaxID=2545756 RepID=UPI0010F59E59|nr:hypothetical protein [Marimonas lutisalis]
MIQKDLIVQSSAILKRLSEAGYDFEVEDDFDAVIEWNRKSNRVRPQHPMISPMRNDYTRGTAFWTFLLKDGERLGALGARFIDLRGEPLDRYIRRTAKAQFGNGEDVIESIAPVMSELIGGRIVVFGDLFIRENARGNARVLAAYSRLSMILAGMEWPDFDWMFAYIAREHLRLSDLYGFTYRLPRVIIWRKPYPEGRDDSHMLVAIPACDFRHLLATGEMSKF